MLIVSWDTYLKEYTEFPGEVDIIENDQGSEWQSTLNKTVTAAREGQGFIPVEVCSGFKAKLM